MQTALSFEDLTVCRLLRKWAIKNSHLLYVTSNTAETVNDTRHFWNYRKKRQEWILRWLPGVSVLYITTKYFQPWGTPKSKPFSWEHHKFLTSAIKPRYDPNSVLGALWNCAHTVRCELFGLIWIHCGDFRSIVRNVTAYTVRATLPSLLANRVN